MKYNHLISNLEKIIENWYDKENLYKLIGYPNDGLCDNIKYVSHTEIPFEYIKSWKYFNGDYVFSVNGREEYNNGLKEPYALFNNPKRLHLAIHMLSWLRANNV